MTTTRSTSNVTTFTIDVPDADLADLLDRVAHSRLPATLGGDDEHGFPTSAARRLLEHWTHRFDWRAQEAAINELEHLLVDVGGGRSVHVARQCSDGDAVPVVLVHGWPDSFLRYRHLTGPLTRAGHDVLLPSLPGFAWSDQPSGAATVEDAAEVIALALDALGVDRFAVHGGDWGSPVAEALAATHPDKVVGQHLTDVPMGRQFGSTPEDATPAERAFLDAGAAWAEGAAYFSVQGTQSTTLALALADSPLGLSAWWAEKYGAWTDRDPDLDEILTQVCLTWFTRTEHSCMRLYAEAWGSDDWTEDSWDQDAPEGAGSTDQAAWSVEDTGADVARVPAGFAIFPHDIGVPPREWAERFFDVRRFTLMPGGGHFGALEDPAGLAAEIVAFVAEVTG